MTEKFISSGKPVRTCPPVQNVSRWTTRGQLKINLSVSESIIITESGQHGQVGQQKVNKNITNNAVVVFRAKKREIENHALSSIYLPIWYVTHDDGHMDITINIVTKLIVNVVTMYYCLTFVPARMKIFTNTRQAKLSI